MIDIVKKFKFKSTGTVLYAPVEIENELLTLGFKNKLDRKQPNRDTLIFVKNQKEFIDFLKHKINSIEPDSVLWFAYPKGTSGIKTDINRDILRVIAQESGLKTVTAISIDNTWTALRVRPIDKVGT